MNKLGFGFLRLPRADKRDENSIDWPLLENMVDRFIAAGGRYFDTAYTYMDGKSEEAVGHVLSKRYPRDSFVLATKLPGYKAQSREDCEKFFAVQCERCCVDWFDVYMLHWLNRENYATAMKFDEFGFLCRLKEQGKAKKIGFSYHGDARLLDEILSTHPYVDIVQLQINYLDWDDPAIEAKKCYEIAVKHGKDVVVMEPVKGGTLADLPREAKRLLEKSIPGSSPAFRALRFAAGLENVRVVLSGMNTMEQMEDNLQKMEPLTRRQKSRLADVRKILNRRVAVPCTGCRYCVTHCPENIPIPDYFAIYNSYCRYPKDGWKMKPVYQKIALTKGMASQCIGCGQCAANCTQGIEIPGFMPKIAEVME